MLTAAAHNDDDDERRIGSFKLHGCASSATDVVLLYICKGSYCTRTRRIVCLFVHLSPRDKIRKKRRRDVIQLDKDEK